MHAGQMARLEDVVSHYAKAPPAAVGHSELAPHAGRTGERRPIRLSSQEVVDLVRFLGTLSGPVVEAAEP
jgi:cytochrome c peroxidase